MKSVNVSFLHCVRLLLNSHSSWDAGTHTCAHTTKELCHHPPSCDRGPHVGKTGE